MIKWLIVIVVVASFLSETLNQAKLGDNLTPTLAPSKTPTLSPTTTPKPAISTRTAGTTSSLTDTFTQDDLSVLTGNIQRPNGMIWYNGKIYVSCSGDWTLYQIDPSNSTTAQYIYGVKNAHSFYATTDEDGVSLWIPDFQSNTLVQISKGVSKNIASKLQGPWGIADLDGERFLVTNLLSNNVLSISRGGETKEVITNLRSPAGIVVDGDYVYVANTGSARRAVEWFDTASLDEIDVVDAQDKSLAHSLITGLQNVTNLVLAKDGYLYFSYALGTRGVVGRVDPAACRDNGGCTSEEVEIVIYSELAAPLAGLSISPDLRLFVHSIFSPDIYWIQLNENT
jgi:hypothetical protein